MVAISSWPKIQQRQSAGGWTGKAATWWLWPKCGNAWLEGWGDWCGGFPDSWLQFQKRAETFSRWF